VLAGFRTVNLNGNSVESSEETAVRRNTVVKASWHWLQLSKIAVLNNVGECHGTMPSV